jgi:hypothetical protein
MIEKGDIIILSKKEVQTLIDNECQHRLGISRKDFIQQRKNGTLLKSGAVKDIEMLFELERRNI